MTTRTYDGHQLPPVTFLYERQKGLEQALNFAREERKEKKGGIRKMNNKKLTPSIYRYVMGVLKGTGKSLGEIASEARSFEFDLVCWIDVLNSREGGKC